MEHYTREVKDNFKMVVRERTARVRRELNNIERLLNEIENGPPSWEIKKDKPAPLSGKSLKLALDLTKKYDVNDSFTATDIFNYLWDSDDCRYFRKEVKDGLFYCMVDGKPIEPNKVRNEMIPNTLNALVEKGVLKTRIAYGKSNSRILMMRHYALLTKDINKSNDV